MEIPITDNFMSNIYGHIRYMSFIFIYHKYKIYINYEVRLEFVMFKS